MEFWKERAAHEQVWARQDGWEHYEGPHGLLKDVWPDGGRIKISIRYYSSFPTSDIIGLGKNEAEATDDWVHFAEKDIEEAERELDALREAVAAIRKMKDGENNEVL